MHPTTLKFTERAAGAGLVVEPRELDASTRTAAEAADAVGCELGQIVKSVVLMDGADQPLLVLCAGDRRIDVEALGDGARMARGSEVKGATGYAIGGVPPLGHDAPITTLVDRSLERFPSIWCAAGTPNSVCEVPLPALLAALPAYSLTDATTG
jgi:prolyl-tRNA editing enzyme YbaK/EbsC (Cys-tRNA(Pro) deacylase)